MGPVKRETFSSFIAIVCAAFVASLVSNDWCFVFFPAAAICLGADLLIRYTIGWRCIPTQPRRSLVRLACILLVGVAAGAYLRLDPDWAFRQAFRIKMPETVEITRMRRYYAGGPGDYDLVIDFQTEQATIDKLAGQRPAIPETYLTREWKERGGGWDEAWVALRGTWAISLPTWEAIRPMQDLEIIVLGSRLNVAERTVLLWEKHTGRAVALYALG